jgi:hypothetical protein
VLGCTQKLTDPLPVPPPPEVIVIHETLLDAVQEQEGWVFTPALPLPPEAGKDEG